MPRRHMPLPWSEVAAAADSDDLLFFFERRFQKSYQLVNSHEIRDFVQKRFSINSCAARGGNMPFYPPLEKLATDKSYSLLTAFFF